MIYHLFISIHGIDLAKSVLPWSLFKVICSTGPLHRRRQTWTWERWEILQLPTTNPASGWKSGLRLWRKGRHFDPKKHPSRKQLKSCIRGPKHQRTIYYLISDLISPKKNNIALVVGLSCISDSCWSTYWWLTLIADASAIGSAFQFSSRTLEKKDCRVSTHWCEWCRPEPWRPKSIEHGTSKVGSQ